MIWIIDFGSQYTQLITRKTRELGFSSQLVTFDGAKELQNQGLRPKAIVLSGGPQSIFEDDSDFDFIFELKVPVLGICYGMQIIAHYFDGKVSRGKKGEYGSTQVSFTSKSTVAGVPDQLSVWMSHFDSIEEAPSGFDVILKSKNGLIAGLEDKERQILSFQFHPEVAHSDYGMELLEHFFFTLAQLSKDWSSKTMLENCLEEVSIAKDSYVLCAFSGGVDSLVAATAAHQVLKDKLYCFFVDNGLLRPQDYIHIETLKKETELNIEIVDAKEHFLSRLAGVTDPEKKRKIIGNSFIEIFEEKVHSFEEKNKIKFEYLLQGTLYPDVIESADTNVDPQTGERVAVKIKSHHNVGGLPKDLRFKLVEPLRKLFKDEVRKVALSIGLPKEIVRRHPFPGPGLAIRIIGEVTPERLNILRDADYIVRDEIGKQGMYHDFWQAFAVLLPVRSVGVMGDQRTYAHPIVLRLISSEDGMTADWSRVPYELLETISNRIVNEVDGVNRVVYDITSKPPGTIEWE